MLLIVDSNWGHLAGFCNILATLRKVEGIDYVLSRSFDEARESFIKYGDQIKAVIVEHNLEGQKTGLDVVKAVRRNEGEVFIVRCSTFNERGYPPVIRYFNKLEKREAIQLVLDRIESLVR